MHTSCSRRPAVIKFLMYYSGAAVRYSKLGLAWVLDSQTWVLASLSLFLFLFFFIFFLKLSQCRYILGCTHFSVRFHWSIFCNHVPSIFYSFNWSVVVGQVLKIRDINTPFCEFTPKNNINKKNNIFRPKRSFSFLIRREAL